MHEIKLYQLLEIISHDVDQNEYLMTIYLKIPNVHKIFFLINYNILKYKLHYHNMSDLTAFLKKLKFLCSHQRLDVRFQETKEIKKEVDNN